MEGSMERLVHRLLEEDPYIQYKGFAYSYATQLTINGIILSLLVVLLIHLLFTAPSHYALARLNFLLQFSGVLVTLIAVAATIGVILSTGSRETNLWPYMTDYIYVDMPPSRWNTGELVLWYTMEAISSGIVQITHIQFLTLLYPSDLEARLIFGLLGPIALASSATTFAALSSSESSIRAGLIARNIFNSTLTLLFTSALFIWGLYINRRRAWRTDGGTAAFGAGALVLAVGGTAVNFLEVKVDGLEWLNHLLWAIILWQSWVGWWWWVGAGMGIGEVEDLMEKEHRRARKAQARKLKAELRLAAKVARSTSSGAEGDGGVGANGGGRGSASGSSTIGRRIGELTIGLSRRTTRRTTSRMEQGEQVELSDLRERRIERESLRQQQLEQERHESYLERPPLGDREATLPLPATAAGAGSPLVNGVGGAATGSAVSTSSPTSSSSSPSLPAAPSSMSALLGYPYALSVYVLSRLARAHDEATKARVHKVRRSGGRAGRPGGHKADGLPERRGWGLGEFGVEEVRGGEDRLRDAQRELRAGRLLVGEADEDEDESERLTGGQGEAEWVDEEVIQPARPARRLSRRNQSRAERRAQRSANDLDSSWSWWGPLRRWRLQDRTEYT